MEDVMRSCAEWKGWRNARANLFEWRSSGQKRSNLVLSLGARLLKDHSSRFSSTELWDLYEQVCVAALDCGDMDTAKECYGRLECQFPNSIRVLKLNGMILEAQGKYTEALKFYKDSLENHPSNVTLWKRKVSVFKSMGDTAKAIVELNSLLTVFMSDQEAWSELADLYLERNNYEKAAFCLEELLLVNPHHHLYHQRYAEICYSQKTVESLEVARKHFALASKLNPNNMRALYGFYMSSLSQHCKVKNRETRLQNNNYCDWARAQIRHKYMQFDTEKLQVVERMLEKTL